MATTTTQRGYGWRHQQVRARLLANHKDGTPCPGCGKPMYRNPNHNHDKAPLEADHTKDLKHHGPSNADRLMCRTCNRTRGAGHDERLPVNQQPDTKDTTLTTNNTTPSDWSWLQTAKTTES